MSLSPSIKYVKNNQIDYTANELAKYTTSGLQSDISEYFRALFFDNLELPKFDSELLSRKTYDSFVELKINMIYKEIEKHKFIIRRSVPTCVKANDNAELDVVIDLMLEHQNNYSERYRYIGITSDFDIHLNKTPIISNYHNIYTLDYSERTKIENHIHDCSGVSVYENPFTFALNKLQVHKMKPKLIFNKKNLRKMRLGVSGSILNSLNSVRHKQLDYLSKYFELEVINGFLNYSEYESFLKRCDIIFCPSRNPGSILTRGLDAICLDKPILVEDKSTMKKLFPNYCLDFCDLDGIINKGDLIVLDRNNDKKLLETYTPESIAHKFFKIIQLTSIVNNVKYEV